MKAPTQKEIEAYDQRIKNLVKEAPGIPGSSMLDLNAETPGPNPRIQIDKWCVHLFVYPGPNPYSIELDRINTKGKLLTWALHLCGKTWMNTALLGEFIKRVSEHNGWNPHADA